MQAVIYPSVVSGEVVVSTSKSCMQRACALALIHNGITHIANPGKSHDDKAALAIINNLGADVTKENGNLIIRSKGVLPRENSIYCGESGLSIRMFTPIAATSKEMISVEGGGSLSSRPMHFFEETLPHLQVSVTSNQGKLPLRVKGPLQPPPHIAVSGALSSQYITGLLIAYAAQKSMHSTLAVNSPTSTPYIALTLGMMSHFGYDVMHDTKYDYYTFHDNTYTRLSNEVFYTVEGDWSGAAFLIVVAATQGDCVFDGLEKESTQADKAILDALDKAGVRYGWEGTSLKVYKSTIAPFKFDATHCPDLFPPLVALAAFANGKSTIVGAHRLTHKESNRSVTLRSEFQKLGVHVEVEGDTMLVNGKSVLSGGIVSSHNDHRIAMGCAVAALGARDKVIIENAAAVNKSYPHFYEDIKQMGASVDTHE